MSEHYYTTHEVSKLFNVYPTTVVNWINEGILPAFTTPGGHRRIKKEDIISLMKKNNMPIPEELQRESKLRVIVIDDDAKITRMVKTILESEGEFIVLTADSGFGAGLLISEWKPDVILLDFLMPDIDGFEVTSMLKENEKTKDWPIIAITVLRDPKEIKKMYDCGVSDYLAKPFKSTELIEKIKKNI